MNGQSDSGKVMQPKEPLLINIDGQIDNEKHPFIIVTCDDEAVYGFHMTSHINPTNIFDTLTTVRLEANKHIEYYNKLITQDSYVKVDHIHKIKYEDMYKCNHFGFVKPNTKETLYELLIQHLFITDYELVPSNEHTNEVISLSGFSKPDMRSSLRYSEGRKIFSNPIYADKIQERTNKVKSIEQAKRELLYILSQITTETEEYCEEEHYRRVA